MSQIKVELLDSMGDDLRVANVARVSFGKWKEEMDEKDARLINYLGEHGHTTPFRHVQIQVRCKAPIFLARQLGKHQVGLAWNEISRRYVDVDIEFYEPVVWRSRPEGGIKQGSGQRNISHLFYEYDGDKDYQPIEEAYYYQLSSAIELYERMVAQDVAPEMARMVLPQSMMVDWIWTGSLQAFFHIYRLRSGEGAQQEAKDFAEQLKQVIEPIFPNAWKALDNAQDN